MEPSPAARMVPGRRLCGAVLAAVVVLVGCSGMGDDDTQPLEAGSEAGERSQRVAAELEEAGLSTIASAVLDADLDEVVGTTAFTLFAPDDEAFQSLTADELANLTSETDRMAAMLRDHVVEGAISAEDLAGMSEVTTVGGTTLEVGTDGDTVTVGDAAVVQTVGPTGDAMVHVVDALLVRE